MKNKFSNKEYELLSCLLVREYDRLHAAKKSGHYSHRSEFSSEEEIDEQLRIVQLTEEKINEE